MITTKKKLTEIYARHTGKDYEHLNTMLERDYFLSAQEAADFGLVDHVVKFRKGSAGEGNVK
jgi:ATP-dependent Clp protease protease subunit